VTTALHWLPVIVCVMSDGQSIPQSPLPPPATVTLKLQVAVLFAGSVAVQLTVVVPDENLEPDGGLQTIVTQLPFVVGGG
jgi:hypothetical protein